MGNSYTVAANIGDDIIRKLFSWLDRPVYDLLGLIYRLFFNVASADIFSNNTMMKFYSRVQLILGVFMMFHLAMTILKGIMNPDGFTDSKTGIGNLIMRICVSLFLLTSLVPISISDPQNEYEKQINNNGLLFGTLYSLQHRILLNNTIGRLILGTDDTTDNYVAGSSTDELETASNIFTATILKGFFRINLLPDEERNQIQECVDADDPATVNSCRMCQNDVDDHITVYKKIDVSPGELLSMVNETCEYDCTLCVFSYLRGKERYVFNYAPIISTVTGVIFIFILISFTIDVAVRLVKLSILRLLAPIPIISYMDPKGSKDGAFNSWVKTLTSTYLDLFVRLAVVYFVIFLIQQMIANKIMVNHGDGVLGAFTLVILWIGLFIFAKQAPKFIRQVLGLKDDQFRLFGGISDALAIGSIGAGVVSGGISGAVSAHQNNNGNVGKTILGAITGSVGGGVNAGRTYYGSKDANASTIMNANRKYADQRYSNAADESTPMGRMAAGFASNIGLKNKLQQLDDQMKYYNAANDALGRVNKAFDNNGDYKVNFDSAFASKLAQTGTGKGFSYNFDSSGNLTDKNGNVILRNGHSYSLKDLNDMISNVASSSDADMKDAVAEAKKQAQGIRFKEIRAVGGSAADRKKLEGWVNDKNNTAWTESDLIAYDALHTIYDVGKKYGDEVTFQDLRGKEFNDPNVSWGQYKGAASKAGRKAEQIKNSNEYAQASADAQRVKQQQNKK